MASTSSTLLLQALSLSSSQIPPIKHSPNYISSPARNPHQNPPPLKCTRNSDHPTSEQDPENFPGPGSDTTSTSSEKFPIEKRRPSVIIRDRKNKKNENLVPPEPKNFEIGWKRTKEIKIEKPKGWIIADFLEKLETLMGMEFGTTELLAKTGEIVAERAREETEVLREKGDVDDRMVTELYRVLRLLEMDLAMVKAAKKEETLGERLEQAKVRCRQAILVALSF